MNEGILVCPIPLRHHKIALHARWPRGRRRHFPGLDARRPIGQSLFEQISAQPFSRLIHAAVEMDKGVPDRRVRITAHGHHPDLMALIAAGPKRRKPLLLAVIYRRKFFLGGRMNQRSPVSGWINLGRLLRASGARDLKLNVIAAGSFDALGVLQPVAPHP